MKISNHAEVRYAQRIMNRDEKNDVNVYIAQNKDKIHTNIEKMVTYGTVIYVGKTDKNSNETTVLLKDTWVVLYDHKNDTVITLYSIDLGVGKDFNEQYINLLLERLNIAQESYENKKNELQSNISEWKQQQEDNRIKVTEYRQLANELEKANDNLDAVIKDYETQIYIAGEEIREIVSILIGKKVY